MIRNKLREELNKGSFFFSFCANNTCPIMKESIKTDYILGVVNI